MECSHPKSFYSRLCRDCWIADRRQKAFDSFWFKVAIGESEQCWPWQGSLFPNGYGRFRPTKALPTKLAHREAYERIYGQIPSGQYVLHRCDNPACCKPAHLFLGTQQNNMDDMLAKGRSATPEQKKHLGEQHGRAKLTWVKVAQIRQQWKGRGLGPTYQELATEYGVSKGMIGFIVRGENWKSNEV